MQQGAQAALAAALASCNLRALHLLRSDGTRPVDELAALAQAASAAQPSASSAVGPASARPQQQQLLNARLHAVLDGALGCSMGCWVVDYVMEVRVGGAGRTQCCMPAAGLAWRQLRACTQQPGCQAAQQPRGQ